MTVIVGVLCKDAVVIGSDSSATFVTPELKGTIEQKTEKIETVDSRIIVAGSGEVGKGQRFKEIVRIASQNNKFSKGETAIGVTKHISHEAIKDFSFTFSGNASAGEFSKHQYGAIIAFPLGSTLSLCEFHPFNFQPELKDKNIWFVSLGSGQNIADPFLAFIKNIFWKNEMPTRSEGIFATTWTIQHAIDVNPGGIKGPIKIATLELDKKGNAIARNLEEDQMAEHYERIEEINTYLKNFKSIKASKNLPRPPK